MGNFKNNHKNTKSIILTSKRDGRDKDLSIYKKKKQCKLEKKKTCSIQSNFRKVKKIVKENHNKMKSIKQKTIEKSQNIKHKVFFKE